MVRQLVGSGDAAGLVLIWIAALLTAITGWDYFDKARPFLRDGDGH
jgi:Co/Zn/Cd efflux system component